MPISPSHLSVFLACIGVSILRNYARRGGPGPDVGGRLLAWLGGQPPRRPRRRWGRAAASVSHSASTVETPARTALSFPQSSGLRRRSRSTSWSRSSGLRDRRVIRCSSSPYRARSRAASGPPTTRARTTSSSTATTGAGGAGRAVLALTRLEAGRPGAGLTGAAFLHERVPVEGEIGMRVLEPRARFIVERASPDTSMCAGDRNRYSTRASPPAAWRRAIAVHHVRGLVASLVARVSEERHS